MPAIRGKKSRGEDHGHGSEYVGDGVSDADVLQRLGLGDSSRHGRQAALDGILGAGEGRRVRECAGEHSGAEEGRAGLDADGEDE
jgi:hypothetical protein